MTMLLYLTMTGKNVAVGITFTGGFTIKWNIWIGYPIYP